MATWTDLTDEQKTKLVSNSSLDVSATAASLGMRPETLSRRLREYRQYHLPTTFTPVALNTASAVSNHRIAEYQPPVGKEVLMLANPTDAHGLYADPYAWELALKCIELMAPNHITWGNDAMDFETLGEFAPDGPRYSVADELKDEKLKRRALQSAAPDAEVWWVMDNHTYTRYQRFIYRKAPELAEIDELKFHNLVAIDESRLIEAFLAGDTLRVIHGSKIKSLPGESVRAEIADSGNRRGRVVRSVMVGHNHRFAHVVMDNGIEGLECGCLCDLHPHYKKMKRSWTNWVHGLGFARYSLDWSEIIPARFLKMGGRLVCRLEGQELAVQIGKGYTGE